MRGSPPENPKKMPSGHYRIMFRDLTGHRRFETFERYKDAVTALSERRLAVKSREYVAPTKLPAVKEAADSWLEGKRISESKQGTPIKPTTLSFWQNHIDRYIVPTLGRYRVDYVDTTLIEKQRGIWRLMGNLKGTSVNKIMTTLASIFDKQVKVRNLKYNPVTLADRLATGTYEVDGENGTEGAKVEVGPHDVYNPEQLFQLFEAASPGRERTMLMVFALTMIRHGEGLGLKWSDIDFDRNEINIQRSWGWSYRGTEPIFWTPKSKSSTRTIPFDNTLATELKKWKLRCPRSQWDLVFPYDDGRPLHRITAWRAIGRAARDANKKIQDPAKRLRRLSIHNLRHTGASIHLMCGTPLPEVSAMLGHANVNITLTVYTHFIPKLRSKSVSVLSDAVFGKKGEFDVEGKADRV